jgi:hypothetical protein
MIGARIVNLLLTSDKTAYQVPRTLGNEEPMKNSTLA